MSKSLLPKFCLQKFYGFRSLSLILYETFSADIIPTCSMRNLGILRLNNFLPSEKQNSSYDCLALKFIVFATKNSATPGWRPKIPVWLTDLVAKKTVLPVYPASVRLRTCCYETNHNGYE